MSKSDGSDPLLVVDDERLVWCRSMFAGCEEDSTLELLVLLELMKDSPSTRFEGAEHRLLVKRSYEEWRHEFARFFAIEYCLFLLRDKH